MGTGRQEEKNTICGICPAGCWVTATLEDGKLIKVRAQEDHPLGMICEIGSHAPEIVYSEHRIQTPMRRVGPKGSMDFEPIGWDEAFALMEERLQGIKQAFGAEALGIYTGRGSFELAMCDLLQPKEAAISSASSILFPFGSPNTFGVGALCYVSMAMIAPHVTMGGMFHTMESDIDRAELIIVWGANPATDSPPLVHEKILHARARGAEVIVIDPRRNGTAKASGAEWIPIRPGTDGALALGMIQVLVEEELFDEAFVEDWTVGFDELCQYTQHFSAEVVENITGVPAETVRSLARRIAVANGVAPVMYTGLEYSDSGVQAIRATMILWALAGQLDVPGGRLFRMRENTFAINREGLQANPDIRRAIGRDRFPLYSQYRGESHAIALPEAVLEGKPYPIRGLIILGGSIITAWPQPDIWQKTLGGLDFLVTIDRQLTADAAYADLVLPATTGFEIQSYMTYGPLFRLRERLIEPVGEARNDFLILTELAARLGYGECYPQTEDAIVEQALRGSGYSLSDVINNGGSVEAPGRIMEYRKWEKGLLRPDGQPGFDTPSGKFEIASSILKEHGYDPLPVYTEPGEGPLARPDLLDKYPLVFNSGSRIRHDFRSQHHGIPGLRKRAPDPGVQMHPSDAGVRGIQHGDWVSVVTARGAVRFRALLTEDIAPGSVDCSMGGGGPVGPESWQRANVNVLTDLQRYDPVSGFPVYKALMCEVVRAEAGADAGTPLPDTFEEGGRRIQATTSVYREVYLDGNATTPVDSAVADAMLPYMTHIFGNASSIHKRGVAARVALEDARRKVAQVLNVTAKRILFCGSGSEASNMAIKGVVEPHISSGAHIVTTMIEHPSVLETCRHLETRGVAVTYLPVTPDGVVDVETYRRSLRADTVLVTVMLANNETGVIQPVAELASIARERGVLFHTDAVQAFGKISIDLEALGVDLASFSGHKVHAPKGIGVLYVRKGVNISPLVQGGKQESGLRAGTENVASIVGLGVAAQFAQQRMAHWPEVERLRDRLQSGILELCPTALIHGISAQRLPNTLSLTLPTFRGESMVYALDRWGIAISSGSACKAGSPEPSHALLALGLSAQEVHCSIRLSLMTDTCEADIEYVLEAIAGVLEASRHVIQFSPCR